MVEHGETIEVIIVTSHYYSLTNERRPQALCVNGHNKRVQENGLF